MDRNRAAVAVSFGVVAVALAVTAVVTDRTLLVLLAAVAATATAVMASESVWRRLFGTVSKADLQAAAIRLDEQRRKALEQASYYEADALRARRELAAAMSSDILGFDHEEHGDADPEESMPPSPPVAVPFRAPAHGLPMTDHLLDAETGAFSEVFFAESLKKRVAAARRGMRHLSVVIVDVVQGASEARPLPADPTVVVRTMTAVFREADTIARADDGTFLLLFEDTPETGAIWTMERFRRRLADDNDGLTVWAGMSCYPTYGFTPEQLLQQAHDALDAAREWPADRVEVTDARPD